MPDTVLNRAIEKFRQSLTDEQKKFFVASSLDNVKDEIQSIQGRYGSQKKLRSLNRLSKFLEAMTQIEQLVQIFLNVSEVVAFVWGPIKLALMMAGTRVQTLEQLLDTYVEIGEVIPSLKQYETLFKEAPAVLEVLEKYFCDILEFHRNAMDVFARPGWRTCFDSTWKTFRSRFNPILESLKRHRALLLDERLNAAVAGIQESRDKTLQFLKNTAYQSSANFDRLDDKVGDVYKVLSAQIYGLTQSSGKIIATLQRDLPLEKMNSMFTKLDPPDYQADQQMALTSCHGDSGTWIFQSPSFLNWMQSRVLPDCTLFIHGMPGAGKTSLAARIISHFSAQQDPNHTSFLYFYFKHADNDKRTLSHMLRAFLVQMIRQDATLALVLYEKCCSVSTTEAQKTATLQNWAAELLPTQTRCTIVLDGLDECNHHSDGQESRRVLEWFLKSVIPNCVREGSEIRLLCLGQRDGLVDHILCDYPSIFLDTSALHLDDIRSFAGFRASGVAQRFSLDSHEEQAIVQKVVASSNAMFLYARLVMDNLMAQGSTAELDEELNVNFPKGLDEAYERVAIRILDHPRRSQSQRAAAGQILDWLTCSVRPLRWREIQSLFCIDPHNGTSNPRNRRVDSCKCICGSFVEMDRLESALVSLDGTDPVVSLVHDTARRYLIQSNRVNLPEASASMAIFSSAYLVSLPFKADPSTDLRGYALNGYFGLLDYFVSSWNDHLNLSIEQSHGLSPSTLHHLQQAVIALMQHLTRNQMSEDTGEDLERLKSYFNSQSMKYSINRLEHMSTGIRKVVEGIDTTALDDRSRDVFFSLNGKQRYKCSKSRCLRFSEGFKSREERDRHVTQHYAPFTCSVESCPRRKVGFIARSDLDQHTKEVHTRPTNKPTGLFPSTSKPLDPLHDACERGDMQAIRDLTTSATGLRVEREHIALAAKNGHIDICEYFARNAEEPCRAELRDAPTLKSLDQAIISNDTNMFRVLVEAATPEQKDKELDSNNSMILARIAVQIGRREMFDTLLSIRFDMKAPPLSYAKILVGAFKTIQLYEEERIFGRGNVWLGRLIKMRQVYSIFDYVMSFVPPGDVSTIFSARTLDAAISSNYPSAMLYLMQHMDENTMKLKSQARDSPIYKAIKGRQFKCLQTLLEHGFVNDMRTTDNKTGDRPLHHACRVYEPEFSMLLLPYSMDHINEPNADGETPLHIAVQRGAVKISKALLDTGAVDIYQRDGKGRSVFEMAKKPGVQSLLREASGDPELPMGTTVTTGSNAPEDPEPTEKLESMGDDPTATDRGSDEDFASDLETATARLPPDNDVVGAPESLTLHQGPYTGEIGDPVNGNAVVDDGFTWDDAECAPSLDLD
ncbi:hypothetical protein PG985_010977 [Apiospora marii]|uniref:NACHT domain-containing protein n=1 Tax=Apiospora marii TaxID=335849 RepID=A0ABR1SSD4_9PEZI